MSFCSNCGQPIANGAKFCSNCGTPIDASSANTQSQRKTVYDGVMHKCPHCGEILNSFTSICPACGYELRGTAATTSVEKLYKNIQAVKNDSEVVRLVKMFPIPNSREDILEFMVLASSNFNEDYYMAHMGEDSISDAWLSKIEQCHKKARLTLSDEDMLEVDEIYEAIKARVVEAKKKANQRYVSQQSEVTAKEFKKSKFRIVLVAFAVISVLFCMLAFHNGRILAGIVSALMVILFLTAFLMGSGVINERVRNFRLVPAILAFLLFVPYFALSDSNDTNHNAEKTTERFDWPETGLGLLLPEPETNIGEIIFDDDEQFWIDLNAASESDYESYIEACKEAGFVVDGEKDSIGYEAYNAEGYHLSVSYMDFSEEISIRLEPPKGDGDLVWPTIGPATLIPQPDSSKGSIEINSHIQLVVYVGETSQDDYNDYVEQCIEWGFNVDYNRSDSVFDADNEIGDSLRVEYQGNNIMYISVCVHDSVAFEEGIDRDVTVENFAFSLPNYWEEEGSKNEYLQYYAEKGDQVVMLSIAYPEESDDEYDVSFEGLYADNDNMVKAVGAMFTDGNVFNYEVFESDYGVKGVLYHFTYSQNMDLFENVDGHGYLFCFPSETDRRWFYITLLYTNNVTNSSDYVDDYMTLLSTIEETL